MDLNKISIVVLAIITIGIISCTGGDMPKGNKTYLSFSEVPDSKWDSLSRAKIYFAHQSVGFNIIDGIKSLMNENSKINLNIVETNIIDNIKTGVFAHSRVGKNKDPNSKIEEFEKNIEGGLGGKVNIAFLKLCFVDINKDSDIDKIFQHYKNTVFVLQNKYPDTKFIHVTVPITAKLTGYKGFIRNTKDAIKKIFGKKVSSLEQNYYRNRYNDLMRNEYEGKDLFFDLAKIEATDAKGEVLIESKDGNKYYSLVENYTSDGGHLNERGKKYIATKLLLYLLSVVKNY